MIMLPILWFLLGVIFFKQKRRMTDEVYKAVYTLTATGAVALGCSGLLNLFLEGYAKEHGFYTQLIWIKTLAIGFFVGVFILMALIENKLKRDSKRYEIEV
jgi:ABC-type uncharacterized transport system permease subunit